MGILVFGDTASWSHRASASTFGKVTLEFFLNEIREADKSLKHELGSISGSCLSHVSCWCCGSMLVSYTRGGWVAGSSPFNVINFFVTEFAEFSEKHLAKTPVI